MQTQVAMTPEDSNNGESCKADRIISIKGHFLSSGQIFFAKRQLRNAGFTALRMIGYREMAGLNQRSGDSLFFIQDVLRKDYEILTH